MISITQNVTSDGRYSAYLPLVIEATDSDNPDYLDFELLEDDNTSLGLPKIRAYKLIGNKYRVDFNAQMKTLYDVRNGMLSNTAIEVLTALYLKVKITDPLGSSTAEESNSFYVYPFIDIDYTNSQTAFSGYDKDYLLSEEPTEIMNTGSITGFRPTYRDRIYGGYSRINLRPQVINIKINFIQTLQFDLTTVYDADDIISIPVNEDMIKNVGGTIKLWDSVDAVSSFFILKPTRAEFSTDSIKPVIVKFLPSTECNLKEFVFINRYGVKDNYYFKTYENEFQATKSDEFFKFSELTNNGNNFVFGSQSEKINQQHSQEYLVDEYFVPYADRERLRDFIKSPKHWLSVQDNLVQVVVFDAKYTIANQSRGVKFSFSYKLAQKELAFI